MSMNSQISVCGTSYPLSPWGEYIIKAKWIDLALAVGTVAFLTFAILASSGVFNSIGNSEAASLSYGMYGTGAFPALLLLTKLVCRYLISEPRKGTPTYIQIKGLEGNLLFSEFIPSIDLQLCASNSNVVFCALNFRNEPTKMALIEPYEAYILIQALDAEKIRITNSRMTVDQYFDSIDKSAWPPLNTKGLFQKIFDEHYQF